MVFEAKTDGSLATGLATESKQISWSITHHLVGDAALYLLRKDCVELDLIEVLSEYP